MVKTTILESTEINTSDSDGENIRARTSTITNTSLRSFKYPEEVRFQTVIYGNIPQKTKKPNHLYLY